MKNIFVILAVVVIIIAAGAYLVSRQPAKKNAGGPQLANQTNTTPKTVNGTETPAPTSNPAPTGSPAGTPSSPATQNNPNTPTPAINRTPAVVPPVQQTANGSVSARARDAKREADMRQMLSAQEMWYGSNNKYYTCSISGGDCRGKINNYPASIGNFVKNIVDPLNSGVGCGKDYVYCALDNTQETNKFCYYAKMEGGGYYTASHAGNFKRQTPPTTFDECAGAFAEGETKPSNPAPTTAQARDALRQSDMRQLLSGQEMYYSSNNRYYTCGPSGGDCKAASRNYPSGLGVNFATTPVDPTNSGSGCGRDFVYCGLDNIPDSQKFCFFAKLEGGGYYTASQAGNFKRSTAPSTLADCALPN